MFDDIKHKIYPTLGLQCICICIFIFICICSWYALYVFIYMQIYQIYYKWLAMQFESQLVVDINKESV